MCVAVCDSGYICGHLFDIVDVCVLLFVIVDVCVCCCLLQ